MSVHYHNYTDYGNNADSYSGNHALHITCLVQHITMEAMCHDRDRTYPYSPCPDLSMPILSHQNHPRAPNATPEPSGSVPSQLVSQQRTPEHSNSLASSQRIPDPTLLQPFLFLTSS